MVRILLRLPPQPMDILYLSHCIPYPPDKGEKIRACHEVQFLAARHRVHLVCFARNAADLDHARRLSGICASVFVERLHTGPALAVAAFHFAMGGSLMAAFYGKRRMRAHVATLVRRAAIGCAIAYSSAMGPYAPESVPLLLDMVDVDSEKWLQYGGVRRLGPLYRLEGRRLRRLEIALATRARRTFLATRQEAALFHKIAPEAPVSCLENGVDTGYFDPERTAIPDELKRRRLLLFAGAMDYYPNADGVARFAADVLPTLRQLDAQLEFFIVGRDPSKRVRALGRQPGVTVTGSVPDVRPYLAAAMGVVTPLRIARGIQNKVLEALAMGKPVLASPAVCSTFDRLPRGVCCCASPREYAAAAASLPGPGWCDPEIRSAACQRFSWGKNLDLLEAELAAIAAPRG